MAELQRSHLCTLGERSEGATIQLTTCGATPKPLREPALVVCSTAELHAQAQGASARSSITETACHHSASLGRSSVF